MIKILETDRLALFEVSQKQPDLILQIPMLLKESVVESLPPNFKNVSDEIKANVWLDQMLAESRLYGIMKRDTHNCLMGFIFVYSDDLNVARIGYLLGEEFWRQGFASEILRGFVSWSVLNTSWTKFIAGVEKNNQGSIFLLEKLGFQLFDESDQVYFYEYVLNESKET